MKRERSAIACTILSLTTLVGTAAGQQPAMKLVPQGVQEPEIVFAPIVVCFAPGTDPVYARRVEAMTAALNQARFGAADYQLTSRWSGAQGSPRALTWSFAPDGLSIPGSNGEPTSNNVLFATLDSAYSGQGGRTTWVSRFVSVFARWQALSGLTYTRVTVGGNDWDDGAVWGSAGAAGLRGDVRISAHPLDGSSGVLAYNQFPSNGDMVMDSQDAGNWASSANSNRFLRNTVAHEHGHGMGLLHVCPLLNSRLMEPFLNTGFDGPQQDDVRAAQRHYGDPFEDNNTAAVADPIGALTIPGSITFGTIPSPSISGAALLSIDADGETDFWSFTVPASCIVSATATPVGTTYLQGPQTGNCDTGTSVNALAIANLSVAIIASNGTTVLGSSDSTGAGSSETVSNVGLPAAGTYYLRITESNSPGETQLYQINVTVTGNPVCPQPSQQPDPQAVCEQTPASFTFVATGNPTPTYQWRRNLNPIAGATSSTYNINSATDALEGSYDCVATNGCGSITSNAVNLTVFNSPAFSQQPGNQNVPLGSPASFSVIVTGDPVPSLQWRKNGSPIGGANGTTYTINSVSAGDVGTYTCTAANICDVLNSNGGELTIAAGGCYANCDGSTSSPLLTANDFQCFLNKFAAAESYANCDGSSGSPLLTANDFQCFLNKFAAGCS